RILSSSFSSTFTASALSTIEETIKCKVSCMFLFYQFHYYLAWLRSISHPVCISFHINLFFAIVFAFFIPSKKFNKAPVPFTPFFLNDESEFPFSFFSCFAKSYYK